MRLTDAAAAEQVDDRQQDHGADQGHQDRADADAFVDRAHAHHRRDHPATDEGADDADDDVQQDALLAIGTHDQAGKPADDSTHDQPNEKAHDALLNAANGVLLRAVQARGLRPPATPFAVA